MEENNNFIQKVGRRRYLLSYGHDESGFSRFSTVIEHLPSLEEIKDAILGFINSEVDKAILGDFVWESDGHQYKVWLSTENQFNYKSAYDLAVQTGGATLPVTFKFGTTEEPEYYTFTTLEELQGFYIQAIQFIQATYQRGWVEKDSIDWNDYEHVVEL